MEELKFASVPFELKQTSEDGEFFRFSGYASTKDLDLGKDIVEPTAFSKFLEKSMPKMLWQHDDSAPLGVFDSAVPDSKGLMVEGRMPKNDTFVSGRIIPQMKIGSLDSMSIRYRVHDSHTDSKGVRTIKQADLPEISLVTFPMNPEARVTALKSELASLSDEQRERVLSNEPDSYSESQLKELSLSVLRKAIQHGKLSSNAARKVAEVFMSGLDANTSGLEQSEALEALRELNRSLRR